MKHVLSKCNTILKALEGMEVVGPFFSTVESEKMTGSLFLYRTEGCLLPSRALS